jgi:hypothetical protein
MNAQLRSAVVRVGDGRGFAVKRRGHLGREEQIIITAAHCLPHVPPCHPARYPEEETYQRLLGPLGGEHTVWATCLFADPMADIAVLGQPDNQAWGDEADAYDQLMESITTLVVADAPAQGIERRRVGEIHIQIPTPGEGAARVLSLKGRWLEGQVARRSGWLAFEPKKYVVGGMSGSPIIDAKGAAIGVVSVDHMNPVILDALSARLVRSILQSQ